MTFKQNIQFTLRIRLFLFFIVLVVTLLMILIILLLATGNITAGLKESEDFIIKEHSDISVHVSEFYENLSAEAVGLANILSFNIEGRLKAKGLNVNDIKESPALIEEILSNELNQVLIYLNKSKSSGAYIILDATINNRLPDSDKSKAGLYIKNMEPNIVNSTSPTIYMLRGSSNIAYKNLIPLHPEWKMEFNVDNAPYFDLPTSKSFNAKGSISKLYYWSPALLFPETHEELMMCSVPLIDSEGNVFGVCGLDVSSMLFKLSFIPDDSMYQRIICMLTPIKDNIIKTEKSLFSGGYTARTSLSNNELNVTIGNGNLFTYSSEESAYIGYHEYFKFYPEQSTFSNERWALTLMIPQEDVKNYVIHENMKLFYICSFFMAISIVASLILSRYYIKPIYSAINTLKDDPNNDVKTNILEIDDLIKYISSREPIKKNIKESDSNSIILSEFLKNLKTLSPAELAVFNLYAQDYCAKEVADKLFLSINTIKTHTKHIYAKLYIKSKDELLLYVEMLKETGKY
ncbi:MAG: response regulator containing a CheY-like receiver domain and an DNA-binding domain [Sedimentibacter sp.]|nr:response regulator containing a CheY-like receiver domain and an DNA-binding domain [Sedimentibacter sp.]